MSTKKPQEDEQGVFEMHGIIITINFIQQDNTIRQPCNTRWPYLDFENSINRMLSCTSPWHLGHHSNSARADGVSWVP